MIWSELKSIISIIHDIRIARKSILFYLFESDIFIDIYNPDMYM